MAQLIAPWRSQRSPNELVDEFWHDHQQYGRLLEELHWIERVSSEALTDIGREIARLAADPDSGDEIHSVIPAEEHWIERQEILRSALYLSAYSMYESDVIDLVQGTHGESALRDGRGHALGALDALKEILKASVVPRVSDWNNLLNRAREIKTLRDELAHQGGYVRLPLSETLRQMEQHGEVTVNDAKRLIVTALGVRQGLGDMKQIARVIGVIPWGFGAREQTKRIDIA